MLREMSYFSQSAWKCVRDGSTNPTCSSRRLGPSYNHRVLLLLLLLLRFVTEDLRLHIFLPNLEKTCSTSPAQSPKLLHSKPLNSLKLKKPPNSHRLNTKGPKPPNPQVGWSLPRVLHHPPKQQGSEICSGSLHSVGLGKGSLRLKVLCFRGLELRV